MAFLERWFGKDKTKNQAKERLQLVLIHDRTDLAPELLEQLRAELIKVICNYLEVDDERIELGLEKEDRAVALVANIPVKNVKRYLSSAK
ncbi:MAG: cell division topological specificity factor MinE [Acetomicrobium sp.]|jgi:cell division topological specificity factor|uniref:cell division topological specificity factor MinE n=1 Tax=Acetomicrobium TaxID=49894 RepID=UPI00169573FC|nr:MULTISPECIES: cell division topological specificity factor MinE [Acetomicrobium]MDI9376768.1 cell division topological specificity factor MinE [Synergistota bacterium]NLI42916.1 cell division topological specificity factor MinE [Synergistaceae bacterium]HOB10703.1 cell division topological specificity factor MinE [Acetomicrobium sp.]HOM97669.1 cell division topological specificity factor MinE [Acetomicrobium sp.]HPT64564.1 cell division topological specificity factor MinE [Acetomicrobium sp